jgi:hypothetical protein
MVSGWRWCAVAVVVLGLVGCENTGGKVAVSGTVSLNGLPVEKGTIDFLLPEATQSTAQALIDRGRYSLPAMQGLLPGKYRVKISSVESFDITPEEYAAGKKAPPPKERIPARYNSESQEFVEVKESGSNRFDFNIE